MKIVITESQYNNLQNYLSSNLNLINEQFWSKLLKMADNAPNAPEILKITNRLEGKFGEGVKLKSFLGKLSKKYNPTTKTFNFGNGISITQENIDKILNNLKDPNIGEKKLNDVLDNLSKIDIGGGKKLSDEFKGIVSGKTKKPQVTTPKPKPIKGITDKFLTKEELFLFVKNMTRDEKFDWMTKNEGIYKKFIKNDEDVAKFFDISTPSFNEYRAISELHRKEGGNLSLSDFMKKRGQKLPSGWVKIPADILDNLFRTRNDINSTTALLLALSKIIAFGTILGFAYKIWTQIERKYLRSKDSIHEEIDNFLSDSDSTFSNGNNINLLNPNISKQTFSVINPEKGEISFDGEGLFIDSEQKKKYNKFKWVSGTFTDTLRPIGEGVNVSSETESTKETFENTPEGFKKWYETPEDKGGYGGKIGDDEKIRGDKDKFEITVLNEPFETYEFKDSSFIKK